MAKRIGGREITESYAVFGVEYDEEGEIRFFQVVDQDEAVALARLLEGHVLRKDIFETDWTRVNGPVR